MWGAVVWFVLWFFSMLWCAFPHSMLRCSLWCGALYAFMCSKLRCVVCGGMAS